MPTRPRIGPILLAAAVELFGSAARAEDIAPFRMTGLEGNVSMRYVSDAADAGQGGGAGSSRQSQSGLRNEIFVMTHSYVYHPNLLTLDVGGGPILHGERVAGPAGDNAARGLLYNFTGRATFLRDKPYRGGAYFEHLNPTLSIAPGQVLLQETTRYGADVSLRDPVTPLPLQLAVSRSHTAGRGSERQIDDRIDQLTLNASRAYGALGSTQFNYQQSRQASTSGGLALPIQASEAANRSLNVDTRLQFGADRQYDVNAFVGANAQQYALGGNAVPDLRDMRLLVDLRARHSARLNTYGTYHLSHSAQGEIDAANRGGSAGLSYWPVPGAEATFGVRGDESRTRQFVVGAYGADGAVRYEHALPLGTAQFAYGLRFDRRDQQALDGQARVLGERLALTGTAYATLSRPRVIAGTPAVSNATRTQTFISGVDYLVSVVGLETRLQRLIGGAILDGEPVLVDYAYDVGGTFAYDQVDQSLNLGWNLSRFVNAFFRQMRSSPQLTSGLPTYPLNPVSSRTFGIRADLPVNPGIALTIGGGCEQENREETIAPHRRRSEDGYVQTGEPLFGLGHVRATMRRSAIDYGNALQNSSLRSLDLRFWTRTRFGADINAALTAERDDGGFQPRRRFDGSVGVQWQERKFTLTSSLVRSHETQGVFTRDRTLFQFLARRDF